MKGKRWIWILGAVLGLIAIGSAAMMRMQSIQAETADEGAGYHLLGPEEAYARIQSGEDLLVVDVRTREEYDAAHLPGALLLPNEEIGAQRPEALADLHQTIFLYCRSGVRSKAAALKLVDMGYTRVYDIGGIINWPYETVSTANEIAREVSEQADAPAGLLSSFTAVDLYGEAVDQSIFLGYDLTMVNVWATYCGPCLREMPDLGELARDYAEQGVQVVGIVVDATDRYGNASESQVEYAKGIVESLGAQYPHILPSQGLNEAFLGGVYSVPTTIFVDKDGAAVGEVYVGARSKDKWAAIIEELLPLAVAQSARQGG